MAHLDTHESADILRAARRRARQSGYLQHVQLMLLAAGLAAFGIVAVAAAMMSTLL
ncbi:MAG: hypothetical protein ACK4G5_03220 [Devosia sp.]|jgi:hypothetical protein|uniref:hypothetical protein n=1 Tax=Devosia sp. XGJD_8 TaxID=3391187 RepID=UPI001DFB9BA8|nr:hypothetical protein [Alphaproteobacteria bacterium]MBU1562849.1 hypothetical protein [Alphaproteobacteria bacterium]MBU2302161.1 hypothetical protein [Alphaproteobacteria bacterium]MBU2368169.1 hypothetical protein [Alphaproteobacteria bacterium]